MNMPKKFFDLLRLNMQLNAFTQMHICQCIFKFRQSAGTQTVYELAAHLRIGDVHCVRGATGFELQRYPVQVFDSGRFHRFFPFKNESTG